MKLKWSRREVLQTALMAAAGTVFGSGTVLGDLVGDGFTVKCLGKRIVTDCKGCNYVIWEYYITHESGFKGYMRLDDNILKYAPDPETYIKSEIGIMKEAMLMQTGNGQPW